MIALMEIIKEEMDFERTVSAGTTYVNAATACQAFGEHERALALFEKARAAYEDGSGTKPELLGGLYNNMALTCVSLRRFREADGLYRKALELMGQVKGGVLEQAITYLNMADAVAAEAGMADIADAEPCMTEDDAEETGMADAEVRIADLLDRAEALLNDPSAPRDGYYAFVCEKCAPTFSYYGYFLTAQELTDRAERIYRENS